MKRFIALSIVVPVYNVEQYLPKCLDSILAQTLYDLEIICVNDGSTDGSGKILDEYAAMDERVRVIHQINSGATNARKAGVYAADGEYIGFVDSDDWIESAFYERVYRVAKKNNADIVTTGYIQEGNYISTSFDNLDSGEYIGRKLTELRNKFFYNLPKKDKGIIASLCTKIFRASLIKRLLSLVPDRLTMCDDKMTNLICMLECESVVVLHEAYYHYIMHASSMTHSVDEDYLLRVNHMYRFIKNLFNHPSFTQDMRIQAELYITQYLLKGINLWLGFYNDNLLWIDPYWLDEIPANSRVVIYGAGDLGKKYFQQLNAISKHFFAGCVDFGYRNMKGYPFDVQSPYNLKDMEYDYVVITIKNRKMAEDVKGRLISLGAKCDSILWFPQDEIFWRFAEADGLLR